ncbi:MAG: hypothetical protein HQL20_05195 [Candidatus Omnitrophica bacterium]|nr:hypothetical protein [Candidatus Omnitrophota bacterium]
MKKFNDVRRLPEFEKEVRRFLKRFSSLEEDLKVFEDKQLVLFHKLGVDNGGVVQITGLGFAEPKIFKARKFACKSLKGRGVQSGIRVIYAYFSIKDAIEYIELYFKADKENEDRERIKVKYFGKSRELPGSRERSIDRYPPE